MMSGFPQCSFSHQLGVVSMPGEADTSGSVVPHWGPQRYTPSGWHWQSIFFLLSGSHLEVLGTGTSAESCFLVSVTSLNTVSSSGLGITNRRKQTFGSRSSGSLSSLENSSLSFQLGRAQDLSTSEPLSPWAPGGQDGQWFMRACWAPSLVID
jgi:hypothetical protein